MSKITRKKLILRSLLQLPSDMSQCVKSTAHLIERLTRKKVLDQAKLCISKNERLAYIVNAKCACSSIQRSIIELDGSNPIINHHNDIHDYCHSNHYLRQLKNIDLNGYYTFTFVRNPFSRILSLYRNKFSDIEAITQHGFDYERYLNGVFKPYMLFEDLVSLIAELPDELSDRHFKSQSFLINQECEGADYVGKLEQINEDFRHIQNKFNLPNLKKNNATKNKAFCPKLNKKTYGKIYERYELDIKEFDYIDYANKLYSRLEE